MHVAHLTKDLIYELLLVKSCCADTSEGWADGFDNMTCYES